MTFATSDLLKNTPQKIIVRIPNWLGDVVMATPVLQDLKNHWRNAKITVMAQSNVANLLKEDPHVDEIFSFKKPNAWLHRIHSPDIINPLQHGKYDLGILLTNSFSSAWWFYRGQVPVRIGFADNMRSCLLTKALPYPKNKEIQHQVITYKEILTPLGIPLSTTAPTLYISPNEKQASQQLLANYGVDHEKNIIIGINPGAAYGSAKCWLPDRFKDLTCRLIENPNVKVVFFGDSAGLSLVNDICADMPNSVINLAGKTSLRELIALIQQCHVFLTNDSGPMHIAAALKTPLVALFGSTSDVKTGPYEFGTVIHKHVECSPCYRRVCPIDFRCMKKIEVDEVFNAIQNLIT
jgi:heptosyltransferase-2